MSRTYEVHATASSEEAMKPASMAPKGQRHGDDSR